MLSGWLDAECILLDLSQCPVELGEYLLLKEFSGLEALQCAEAAVWLPHCGAVPASYTAKVTSQVNITAAAHAAARCSGQ